MKNLVVAFWLVFCVFSVKGQSKTDTATVIVKVFLLDEIDKGLFANEHHSLNCIFIIKEEPSVFLNGDKFSPYRLDLEESTILVYPRKYLIGHNITTWLSIETFNIEDEKADVEFKLIHSSDNWFKENDETFLYGDVSLRKGSDKWTIVKKKIKKP